MPKSAVTGMPASYKDRDSILAPPTHAVTPTQDDVPFPDGPCIGLYVGGAGDVVGMLPDDTTNTTFKTPTPGQILYVQFKSLNAATTATNLRAVY